MKRRSTAKRNHLTCGLTLNIVCAIFLYHVLVFLRFRFCSFLLNFARYYTTNRPFFLYSHPNTMQTPRIRENVWDFIVRLLSVGLARFLRNYTCFHAAFWTDNVFRTNYGLTHRALIACLKTRESCYRLSRILVRAQLADGSLYAS